MIKEEILGLLKEVIKENVSIEIFVPDNENFGHYSTNVAFQLAKARKVFPMVIAQEIVGSVHRTAPDGFFEKIEVVAPGFINFWLKPEVFQKEVKEILKQKENYGKINIGMGKKINLEFISANPTGPLHVGHGRGAFLGDVLANILEFVGYETRREYYVNDAKTGNQIKELGKTASGEGEMYKTPYLTDKINKMKLKDKEFNPEEIGCFLAYEILEDIGRFIENGLKIKFDSWASEESFFRSKAIEKLLDSLKEKGLTYEKEGAVWFKTSEFGDNEDRVLVKNTNEPTYFLSDIAYILNKLEKRKFDQAIDIWGADHHGYEPRLRAAMKALGMDDKKFKVIITQMVRLIKNGKEVKMSKRSGDYFTLKELIEEIGLDAARFFFLMYSPDTHMDFDLGLAKEKSAKNPVYYVQYAGVRCQGILAKNNGQSTMNDEHLKLLNTAEDSNLMRMLAQFPEIIKEAAKNYNPQAVVRYSLELAKEFNNFYEKERVVVEDEKITSARLALISATLIVFKNIFKIIGISLSKKM